MHVDKIFLQLLFHLFKNINIYRQYFWHFLSLTLSIDILVFKHTDYIIIVICQKTLYIAVILYINVEHFGYNTVAIIIKQIVYSFDYNKILEFITIMTSPTVNH